MQPTKPRAPPPLVRRLPPGVPRTDSTPVPPAPTNNSDDSDDDDDDYMSAAFLDNAPPPPPADTYSQRRKRAFHQLNPAPAAPAPTSAREKLAVDMQKPLPASNVGMKLLMRMGFEEGAGLGKDGQGIAEPLAVQLSAGRVGIGAAAAAREVEESESKRRKLITDQALDHGQFREWRGARFMQRTLEQDIAKARKICFQLDGQHEAGEAFSHFWPVSLQPQPTDLKTVANDDAEDPLDGDDDTLGLASSELPQIGGARATTPGLDDEPLDPGAPPFARGPWTDEAVEFESLSLEDQLNQLLDRLREAYMYCLYCGVAYESTDEMLSSCPGKDRADH
ncbi:hypothetical protein BC828DRAFT_405875 [Blastocladiella britannica]|nr:hypothetical protein BC828DRAFT_405875 [Blastocladiella britannica]